jgi:DNA-binding response OmpR family regulator
LQYWFEHFVFDRDRRELRRHDALLPIQAQVFDPLAFLVTNHHRVVSKDDLLASVWGGRIVSESTLFSRITVKTLKRDYARNPAETGCRDRAANGLNLDRGLQRPSSTQRLANALTS